MDAQQYLKNLKESNHDCFSCSPELHRDLFEAAKPLLLSEADLRGYSKEQLLVRIQQLAGEVHRVAGGQKILDDAGYTKAIGVLRDFSKTQLIDLLRGIVISIANEPCHRIKIIEELFKFEPMLLRDFRILFLMTVFRPDKSLEYGIIEATACALRDARAAPFLLKLLSAIENADNSSQYSLDYQQYIHLLGRTGTDDAVAKLDQLLQGEKGDVLMRNGSIGWGGQHPLTLKGVVIKALGDSENELAVRALRKKLESETNHAAREAIQFQLGRLSNTLQEHVKRMPPPPVAAKRNRAPGFRRRRCHPM